jgi:hypothetical protein
LCAQQEELPYKYVSVEGPVEIDRIDADDRAPIEAMAIRYLGDDMGRGYAAQAAGDDEIRLRIRPDRWYSVDYGA